MIQIGTILNILDNSGPLEARCINVLNRKKQASFGDKIILSIQTVKSSSRIRIGTIHLGLVVQVRKSVTFPDGSRLVQGLNGVVLLNNRGDLLARRITAPIILFPKDKVSRMLVPTVDVSLHRLFHKLRILATSII